MKDYLRRPYFTNGDTFQPEVEEKDSPFVNNSLLTVDEQQSFCERHQLIEEKMMQHAIQTMGQLRSHYEDVFDGMDSVVRRRANAMLVQFQQAMSRRHGTDGVTYSVDCYTDESIIIRFSQRKDLRLTINFTEPEFIDANRCTRNIEEAYLSYMKGKKRMIRNSTLDIIINELEKLI